MNISKDDTISLIRATLEGEAMRQSLSYTKPCALEMAKAIYQALVLNAALKSCAEQMEQISKDSDNE